MSADPPFKLIRTEYRHLSEDGSVESYETHAGPCNCRSESRNVYAGPWQTVGGVALSALGTASEGFEVSTPAYDPEMDPETWEKGCPTCQHAPSSHRPTTGCIRCACQHGRATTPD